MDQYKVQQYFNIVDKYFLKRTLQLVLSISIVSCILCFSTGFSFFPHSFNVYFSTFLFSFLTHTLERKYMFLICNGILVFVVKSSVSFTSSSAYVGDEISPASESSEMEASVDVNEEFLLTRATTESSPESVLALPAEEEEEEEEEEEKQKEHVKGRLFIEEEGENEASMADDEDKEEEKVSVVKEKEDNVAEVEGNEDIAISTEELNKRIEEFIRKMKEEIRIEAQQQLITV